MKKQTLSWVGNVLTLQYGNGAKLVADCDKLPESVFRPCDAARHGIGQKLGDAKSGGTAAEKFTEASAIWENLLAGSWNRKGEMGLEIILRAYEIIAAGLGKSEDQAATWMQEYVGADQNRRDEIRSKPHMKSAIAQARLEKNLPEDVDDNFDPNA